MRIHCTCKVFQIVAFSMFAILSSDWTEVKGAELKHMGQTINRHVRGAKKTLNKGFIGHIGLLCLVVLIHLR